MRRDSRFTLTSAMLALTAATLLSLPFGRPSRAQAMRSFEAKADPELKQVYQTFRRSAVATASATRQPERERWQRRVALEEREGQTEVGVLVLLREEDPAAQAAAQAEIEANNFRMRTRIGSVAAATVPVDDLPRLAEVAAVESLSAVGFSYPDGIRPEATAIKSRAALRAMNDAANAAVRAPDARATYNVTGRGVVVGLIDVGIDWRHGDFRRANGTTRIKSLWDTSDPARTGPGGIGRTYTEAQINSALQSGSGVNERDTNGHGTHVAGTVAGNGLGAAGGTPPGAFTGIAPEADLVVVKADRANNGSFRDDDLIAAMAYIRDQAVLLNEPFVINMSLSGVIGQRDGTDAVEVAMDNLLSSGAGRQIVTSAGNVGGTYNHAGGVIAQGTEVRLPFSLGDNSIGLQAIYSGADTLSIRIVKPNNGVVGPVAFGSSVTSDPDVSVTHAASTTGNGARNVMISFKNNLIGNWELVLSGGQVTNGRFDVWATELSRFETLFDPSVADNNYQVGWPKGTRKALVVGSFTSKIQWVDINGQRESIDADLNAAPAFTSAGPTRDGRLKPELTAPGAMLFSTLSADRARPADAQLAPGGKYFATFGTSMSAAVTSGTVALMLQANRNLAPDQIRRLLLRTVTNDAFTGPSVSYKYGYGKLNALAAVKAVVDGVANSEFVSVSAASFASDLIAAPDSILAGFGANLAPNTESAASLPLPTTLAGTSVRLTDSAGGVRLAPLFFVSPAQINYYLPADTAPGVVQVDVVRSGSIVARGAVSASTVWPGLFYINSGGRRVGAANVLRVKSNGQQVYESPFDPIDLSVPGDTVTLVLYGTGLRGRSDVSRVKVTLGGTPLAVSFVGPQGSLIGLDQINAVIPASLAGRGPVDLLTYVDEWPANTIQFTIK